MNKGQRAAFLSDVDATDLSPLQKQKIKDLMAKHCHPSSPRNKIRKVRSKELLTLQEWETVHGTLQLKMIAAWGYGKGICPVLATELIEEFRIEMVSKNKQYANFVAAFQTYLTKGYLSKTIKQIAVENSPHRGQQTQLFNRGVKI